MIAAAPRLRLIQKLGVGVNTIDLEARRRRRRGLQHAGHQSQAVAEMTLALMLAVLRRLSYFDPAMRRGEWAGRGRCRTASASWAAARSGSSLAVEYQRGQSKQFRCLRELMSLKYSTVAASSLLRDQVLTSILNPD